ncbi:MAG: DUF1552 domain-containing protein [Pirellulales bacterium]
MMKHISRRQMLQASGAAVALPLLPSLLPREVRADESNRPPIRMGIFTVAGGTVIESWKPPAAGNLKDLDKLPSILRPLDFAKNDLTVISGLCQDGRSENLNAHEHCAFTHLTGAQSVKKEGGKLFADVSVDQVAARAFASQTYLPSLEMGMTHNQYSFRAPDAIAPFEANPRLIFNRMFRGRQPVVPNWERRANIGYTSNNKTSTEKSLDRNVIDLVLKQANELMGRLGQDDKQKLEHYVDAVHSLEKRIAFIEARHHDEILDLASPGPSQLVLPSNLPPEGVPIWKITHPIDRDPSRHSEYIKLLAELMVLAFQTDSTRVVTVAAGSDEAMFPGVVTVGYERHCHTIEHQGNAGRVEDADPIAREGCRQIHAWYTSLFAEMIKRMKEIDEGGSSLLDNSLILYTSYMANGGHGRDDYPVVLAGGASGQLNKGKHFMFDNKAPVANLYVEMLNMMGIPTESFGNSHTSRYAGGFNGRLPGLTVG